MSRILLIVASVRPTRVGDQIGQWILGQNEARLDIEVVDLKDWSLPMDDEPHQPKKGGIEGYVQEHTRAWSRKIQSGDGFIFVFPQYNWGYPASLKNALDHAYFEWMNKPAVMISYGAGGGPKAADQLAQVLEGLQIKTVATRPGLRLKDATYAGDRLADPFEAFKAHAVSVKSALGELKLALEPVPA